MLYQETFTNSKLLLAIAEALDITEAQYTTVVERYTAVSNHLAKQDSPLSPYKPDIKPQGSFLLGTMIRPILESDGLDVDLVCRLNGKRENWTQKNVKHTVKDQLVTNSNYERMLDEEGNRCWTLLYSESSKFHLDILPAVIGHGHYTLMEKAFNTLSYEQVRELEIRITDRRLDNYPTDPNVLNWLKSNPFGYASWFKERANTSFAKAILLSESVEPLPKYQVEKEPLVRVVQILKRHRDIMFGSNDIKPISIIITTLAAKAYKKEVDIIEAITNILEDMPNHMDRKFSYEHNKDIWWISNPVNDEENFADKWPLESENGPEKEEAFFDWHKKAVKDFDFIKNSDPTKAYRYLKELLGTSSVNEAVKNVGMDSLITERYKPTNYSPNLLTVSHREQPKWPLAIKYAVEVHAHYKDKYKNRVTVTSNTIVPKEASIYFVASTNVPGPYDVYWQVVNTGEEAREAYQLRGGIFHSRTAGKGGLNQKEATAFKGLHWVECFIVKNGQCVARSYEFFVNIQ